MLHCLSIVAYYVLDIGTDNYFQSAQGRKMFSICFLMIVGTLPLVSSGKFEDIAFLFVSILTNSCFGTFLISSQQFLNLVLHTLHQNNLNK